MYNEIAKEIEVDKNTKLNIIGKNSFRFKEAKIPSIQLKQAKIIVMFPVTFFGLINPMKEGKNLYCTPNIIRIGKRSHN